MELLLAVLAALALSVALSLAVGLTAAYAGEADGAADGAAGEESPALDQAGAVGGNAVGTSTGGQAAGASNSATSALDGQSGSPGASSLQAAASPGDPGTTVPQDIEVWLQPKGRTGTAVEGSNDVMVELACVAGEGVEVGVEVSRVRVGDKDTANEDEVTIYNNAPYRREWLGIQDAGTEYNQCIIFHTSRDTTLDQGSYSDKETSEGGDPGLAYPLGGTNAYAGDYFWSMDFTRMAGFTWTGSSFGPYEENVSVEAPFLSTTRSGLGSERLYFPEAGEYYIYAQFTYVEILGEMRQGAYQHYVYEWHAVHASNRVIFKVNVTDAPKTELQVKAKDPNGNDVDIASASDFKVGINKKLGVVGIDGTYREEYEEWHNYSSERDRWIGATAGTYKVKVSSNTGLYVPFEAEITIDASEITGDVLEKVITIVPKDYIPQHNVTFVAEDGVTVLLAAAPYNEDTAGKLVVTPDNVPVKPEDDDYKYVHDGWTIVETGEWVSSPRDVTQDVTYKVYYKPIPKADVYTGPLRVIASGGLYALATKPAGVVSYGLEVSAPTEAQSAALASAYAANIGNDRVLGMYNVDVIQHNEDGSDVSLHEGVGDLTLTFPVDGVADGTALRVLQLHEDGDSTQLIEHKGLVARGGTVDVTLDGRLSTFIILEDLEAQGGTVPSNPSSGASSGTLAGGDTPATETPAVENPKAEAPGADEPATRAMPADDSRIGEGGLADDGRGEDAPGVVKAGPSADGGKTMPQTGDGSRMPLALVLTAFFGVIVLLARGRKAER